MEFHPYVRTSMVNFHWSGKNIPVKLYLQWIGRGLNMTGVNFRILTTKMYFRYIPIPCIVSYIIDCDGLTKIADEINIWNLLINEHSNILLYIFAYVRLTEICIIRHVVHINLLLYDYHRFINVGTMNVVGGFIW